MDQKYLQGLQTYMEKYPQDKVMEKKIIELYKEAQKRQLRAEKESETRYYQPINWDVYIEDAKYTMKSSLEKEPDFMDFTFRAEIMNGWRVSLIKVIGTDRCKIILNLPSLERLAKEHPGTARQPECSAIAFELSLKNLQNLDDIDQYFGYTVESGEDIETYLKDNYDKTDAIERLMLPFRKKARTIDPIEQELLKILLEWFEENRNDSAIQETCFQITGEPPIHEILGNLQELSFPKTIQYASTIASLNLPFTIALIENHRRGNIPTPIPAVANSSSRGLTSGASVIINTYNTGMKNALSLSGYDCLYKKENFLAIKSYLAHLEEVQLPTIKLIKAILEVKENPDVTSNKIIELSKKYERISHVLKKWIEYEKEKLASLNSLKMQTEQLYERLYHESLYKVKEATQYEEALQAYSTMTYWQTTSFLRKEANKRFKLERTKK